MPDTPLLASAAPVFKIDGTRQADLARDVLRLDIEESTEGLRALSLHLVASAPRSQPSTDVVEYLDGAVIDFGKRIEISLGPPGNEKIVFSGLISSIEVSFDEGDAPVVSVAAEDELMKLRMTQRNKTYEQMSDGDIARAIAGEHGLSPSIKADGPTYDVVQQLDESDLAFLRERARRVAAEVWVQQGVLHFESRDQRAGTAVTLTRGGDLVAVEVRADLAHQCSSVNASGFDAANRTAIDERAAGSVVAGEAAGGRTGPQTLDRAFGSLPGRRAMLVPTTTTQARAFAEAELKRRARQFVVARGVTAGTPELVVGSTVTLARCGKPFDGGGYRVVHLRHTYDLQRGHRTHFAAERPHVSVDE